MLLSKSDGPEPPEIKHPVNNMSKGRTWNTEVPGTPPATWLVLLQGHESYLAQVARGQAEASSWSPEQVPPAAQSRSWVCSHRNDPSLRSTPIIPDSVLQTAGSLWLVLFLVFFFAYLPNLF